MARKCKCKGCSKELTTDIAFKVTNSKGKNEYWCSEEEYDLNTKEKLSKDKCLKTITDIYGVKMLPPVVVKKINEIREFYDYIVIEKTFNECKDTIKWALDNKDFNNEFAKTKYIISIVGNNIEKVHKKHKKEMENIKRLFAKDDMLDIIDIDIPTTSSNKTTDISEFLD